MKKSSLFRKLTILIIAAALMITVTTHFALNLNFRRMLNNPDSFRYFRNSVQFIIDNTDMTDTAAVSKNCSRMGLSLRYKIGDSEWRSSTAIPDIELAQRLSHGRSFFLYNKQVGIVINCSKGTFVVIGKRPFESVSFPWDIFLILPVMVVLIFGVVHLLIRKWMRPIRVLQHGVKQVSDGNFNIHLEETTTDELGQLVRLFNTMAERIRNDMKSRDQLLRDISHELRSPLARMLVALEFIPEGNIRQTFKRNISALETMTASILENERLDSPFGKVKLLPVDLKKLLTEIAESRKNSSIPILLEIEKPVTISADAERMRMALSNIIENAVKYSRTESGTAKVTVVCSSDNEQTTITVHDTGIGIPAEEIPFIFEPFYRVDKARRHTSGGYGLGLHLSKKIIEAHSGTIRAESSPVDGTRIIVQLPLQDRRLSL
ncbi:MAG TPA: HAMP domain-containing sensor histidine kinase [Chitinispirillaceae bacterium]|nr:HAMP domain-containing sensor histidine kinase [Chitinispirillaceae bacterium]